MNHFYHKVISDIANNIKKTGVSIIYTGTGPDHTPKLNFAYTIGLYQHNFPEIIMFSLPSNLATKILNNAAKMLRDGQIDINNPITDLANMPLILKPVPAAIAKDYIVMANVYAQKELQVLQMFWPDQNGIFPWEECFMEKYAFMQPLLFQRVQ